MKKQTKNMIILTEEENNVIKNIIDYFDYHNKNLTKEQYNNIQELKNILQNKL